MWRVLRGVLPTREKIKSRGINIDEGCPFCGEVESIDHALINCRIARRVWSLGGYLVPNFNITFKDFLLQVLNSNNAYEKQKFINLV